MKKAKQNRAQRRITLSEFAEHFAEIVEAIDKGEVRGIALAVVTADRANCNRVGVMSSTLTRRGAALFLRDATNDLRGECEQKFHDEMEVACARWRTA